MIYHDISCKANVKMVTFIMIYHDTSQYITICNNTSERGRFYTISLTFDFLVPCIETAADSLGFLPHVPGIHGSSCQPLHNRLGNVYVPGEGPVLHDTSTLL